MAANIFIGGSGSLWSTAANWSLGTIPTQSDGNIATFNASSPNCTLNALVVCNGIDFTGYPGTFNMGSNTLRSYGNVILSNITVIGTGALLFAASSMSVTSNGYVWPNNISTLGISATITFNDNFTTLGSLLHISNAANLTLNGNTLTLGGGISTTIVTGSITGTTNIVMNGTGTIATNNATSGSISSNITINTTGTITIGTLLKYTTGVFKHISGTVVTSNSTIAVGTCTLDLNDITLKNLSINISSTSITSLASNVKIAGLLLNNNTGQTVKSNSAGVKYKLTMLAGSSQTIVGLKATDIDSSDGYPIITNGALSNTNNWYKELPNKMFLTQ